MPKKLNLPENEIRRLYSEGKSLRELSKIFNCSYPTIGRHLVAIGVEIRKWKRIKPINVPNSQEKLAYIAGIVDGEGSVGFIINKKRQREKVAPRVRVANTDSRLIRWLEREVGGYVGNVWYCEKGYKPCYEWIVTGKQNIKQLLHALLPYLIIKRENAIEILEFYEKIEKSADLGG